MGNKGQGEGLTRRKGLDKRRVAEGGEVGGSKLTDLNLRSRGGVEKAESLGNFRASNCSKVLELMRLKEMELTPLCILLVGKLKASHWCRADSGRRFNNVKTGT